MNLPKSRVLTATTIAFINVAAICNIKNFPLLAEFGLSVIIFLALAAIFFFIPASFVSAELASGWPERGIYTWVRAALGPRMGFVAIWLQWIENVIYYPTILTFIATAFAYVFDSALATNKVYIVSVVLAAFWGSTLINFLGMRVSGWISTATVLLGTVVPVVLIALLSIHWISQGYTSQISFSWDHLTPKFYSINDWVLLSGVMFGLAGVEMSSVHAKDVHNPRKSYPKGIFLSAILILGLSTIGALTIGIVVPVDKIQLASGAMEAFRSFFDAFHISWAMPIIAIMTTFGALGMLNAWIVGPSRGLYATALHGDLPPIFHKSNKREMPINILLAQALIVSVLCLVFFFMPTINSSYWIFLVLASILYQLMYILMFVSAIVLRYTHPHVVREYKIPFGNAGMWVVGIFGLIGSSFGFFFCFFPPSQFETGSLLLFESILIGSTVLFSAIPFWMYAVRKPSWHKDAQ